jgi:hypothetical protein
VLPKFVAGFEDYCMLPHGLHVKMVYWWLTCFCVDHLLNTHQSTMYLCKQLSLGTSHSIGCYGIVDVALTSSHCCECSCGKLPKIVSAKLTNSSISSLGATTWPPCAAVWQ